MGLWHFKTKRCTWIFTKVLYVRKYRAKDIWLVKIKLCCCL
jgi:hypothetical protein